jgi:hypothetical protein
MNKELFFLKGTQRYHLELEQLLADFLHVESSVAFGMVCSFISVKRKEKKKGFLFRVLQQMH